MKDLREELARLKTADLYRSMRRVVTTTCGRVTVDGRDALLLCSNNYLGLAEHPALIEASLKAAARFGCGSGASRLVSGNMPLHEALEQEIAVFKGCEAAILFNNGYTANVGILSAIAGRDDTIFSDRLNHASIIDGALLSRAKLVRYPHNDLKTLGRLLAKQDGGGRKIIVTDGIFSMDGDIAPLMGLVELKRRFGAVLMVDDAHGTGAIGACGRGTAEFCGVQDQIDIHMGTLGKALGSFGAYVAGSAELIDFLRNRARSFIFSTSLPPAVLSASITAIEIVSSPEGNALRKQLDLNRNFFVAELTKAGFNTFASTTHIVPIFVGGAAKTMEFSSRLLSRGLFVQGIRPPTVPAGSCRLRCTMMACHTFGDLEKAVATIVATGRELGVV